MKLSLNEFYSGRHWAVRKRIADEFHTIVLLQTRTTCRIKKYPVKMEYEYHINGSLDVSNCAAMTKLIEDGLVCANILKGDSIKFVKEIITREVKEDENKIHVIITIHEPQ